MDGNDFDKAYPARSIDSEIASLQRFRDLEFYDFRDNMTADPIHRRADFGAAVSSLDEVSKLRACATFGDLRKHHPERYAIVRANILLCVNKLRYSP